VTSLRRSLAFASTVAVLTGAGVAGTPATVDLIPTQDNTLFENDFNASSGSGSVLFAGETGNFGSRRAVLAFDIAGNIPPGSAILDVRLTLSVGNAGPGASDTDVFRLHRLLNDWGEAGSISAGGMGAPAHDGDATWSHRFFPDQLWNNLGGDFSLVASAAQQVPLNDFVQFSSATMVADVANWLTGSVDNFGWILIGRESLPSTSRFFPSREWMPQPSLYIEFTAPPGAGAVPNGGSVPGQPLRISKGGTASNPTIDLEWDRGCRVEPDYSVYAGTIGQYYSHGFLVCSTAGLPWVLDVPAGGNDSEYYLVVPVDHADEEGSYGVDADLSQRPIGSVTCPRPQVLADPLCP